jgi:hypothetical protein
MVVGDWHKTWQGRFENTEVKRECPVMNRYADAMVGDVCIEFQHSPISKANVDERTQDWVSIGKTVVWVVDGNDEDIIQIQDRILIDFRNYWKYKHFVDCENVLLNVGDSVYALYPHRVKSHLTELFAVCTVDTFVDYVSRVSFPVPEREHVRTTVYIKQQGAGNGKTYGVVQLIQDPAFAHVNTFIYLTKQHSAKAVIKSEIEDQSRRGLLNQVEGLSEATLDNKKYVITFQHAGVDKKIVIATFDAFVYALGDKTVKGIDMFRKMVQSIVDDEIRCASNGCFKLSGAGYVRLSKQLLLIGDEMQDLDMSYARALLKVSREKYVDLYAVGDRLQSISSVYNALTYLSEHEFHESIFAIVRYPPENKNRRIVSESRDSMIPFINQMVPFATFGLSPIELDPTLCSNEGSRSVRFIHGSDPYQDETKITLEVAQLMTHYAYEVTHHDRKPNDFLIVTSYVRRNPLLEAFHTAIREFWESKENTCKYRQWSVFHKSEEGSSIDLEESMDATRIVSIHSSKGDGRPVVFVMDVVEPVLVKYSDGAKNLVYESLLHVALTRAKERMYIRYVPGNMCDISQRFAAYEGGHHTYAYSLHGLSYSVDIDELIHNKEDVFERFRSNLAFPELPEETFEDKKVLDMKHHIARGLTHHYMTLLCVADTFDNSDQNIVRILEDIRHYKVEVCERARYFQYIQKKKRTASGKYTSDMCELNTIPILRYKSFGGDYSTYLEQILKQIARIQTIPRDQLLKKLGTLGMLVLGHLIALYNHGNFTNFPITDLYDLVHLFSRLTPEEKDAFKQFHYEKLNSIQNRVMSLYDEYPNMKFAIENPVHYKGACDEFGIRHTFSMIGRDKHTVVLCLIQPQLHTLNLHQTVLSAAFYTHLARNATKSESNGHRFDFHNKRIRVCVLAFDQDPVYIDLSEGDLPFRDTLRDELRAHLQRSHERVSDTLRRFQNPVVDLRNLLPQMKKDGYIKRYLTTVEDHIQYADSPALCWKDVMTNLESQLDKRLDRALDQFFGRAADFIQIHHSF